MGTTDYLTRNPSKTQKGEFNDGVFTMMLVEEQNNRKNEMVKDRIFGTLLKERRRLKNKENRNKEKKASKKDRFGRKPNKETKQTELSKTTKDKLIKFDNVINNCYSELVANQNTEINSLCQEMQTKSSLSELARKLKDLSLDDKQKPKSVSNNLKFCDFPIDQVSNLIFPLCLENFSFQPNIETEQLLYHNIANRISELPEVKVKIAKIIAEIQEIEQPEKLFFRDGKWQPKKISES